MPGYNYNRTSYHQGQDRFKVITKVIQIATPVILLVCVLWGQLILDAIGTIYQTFCLEMQSITSAYVLSSLLLSLIFANTFTGVIAIAWYTYQYNIYVREKFLNSNFKKLNIKLILRLLIIVWYKPLGILHSILIWLFTFLLSLSIIAYINGLKISSLFLTLSLIILIFIIITTKIGYKQYGYYYQELSHL
jgi:hypothetical protein